VTPESQFDKDLDHILIDQLHSAKSRMKLYKRLRKVMRNEHLLYVGEEMTDKRIQFFESMIQDKTLLHKKHKRKKRKDLDILAKNPIYDWYKTIFMATTFSYKMFTDSVTQYISYFKKGKE